jgi:hypothetical protein
MTVTEKQQLRVWHIPQVPMKGFHVMADSPDDAALILTTLAHYDLFLFREGLKPDYANAQGLETFDPQDTNDSPDGSWCEWYDDEDYEDIRHWQDEQFVFPERTKPLEVKLGLILTNYEAFQVRHRVKHPFGKTALVLTVTQFLNEFFAKGGKLARYPEV